MTLSKLLLDQKSIRVISLGVLMTTFLNCGDKTSKSEADSPVSEVSDTEVITESPMLESGNYYYASQSPSPLMEGQFSYEFVQFTVDNSTGVAGTYYSSPYGTDGSKGSLKGSLNSSPTRIDVQRNYLAEGERYNESMTYRILPEALDLGFKNPDGQPATLPKVSAERFEELFKSYQKQYLQNTNTTDRSRLKQLTGLMKSMNYTEEDMTTLKFMEVMVELDNDFSTQEYLLYIMDPMLCGSGGCNLYVMSNTGALISELSVTRPPIYVEATSIEESNSKKGEWNSFYVYSDGMRHVAPVNGRYPRNPSVVNEIKLSELKAFPEQYQLVMDYLE